MNRYYVYVFLDSTKSDQFIYGDIKFDYEPFYVGKGTQDRIITSKFDKRTFKSNKIKSILKKEGEVISIKIYDNLTIEESLKKEIELINLIGRKDLGLGPLTNLTDGGDGRLNGKNSDESVEKARLKLIEIARKRKENGTDKHTPEIVERLREINKGENNPMYGKTHSDKVKEEQSLRVSGTNHPMFGKKHDEETIKLIREKRNSVVDQEKMNEESRQRNNKAILQYTLDGEFIQEFESIKVAAQITGLSESLIGKTCRGVVKNPRKFMFRFKDEKSVIFSNSYLIRVGDIVDGYKLIKRNKASVTCENSAGVIINLRRKEYPIFWEKKSL